MKITPNTNIHGAKTRLSALATKGKDGEQVPISKAGEPVARSMSAMEEPGNWILVGVSGKVFVT
jgi:antitoxin (DNA-binding transcriptional repressor) of toxin-antitoxin stability system